MKALTVGSLFSGIGGLDLGLERAGMEIRWQCEIDPFLRRVLAKHWPEVACYKDVREIDEKTPAVDLICGGFPCQPVSTAGRRKGKEDSRWLWPEFNRVIREVRPRWVLVENVPGLLSIEAGRLFGGVLRDLAENGYDAEWDCMPASALGAPHIRDRVFVVAYAASARLRKGQRQEGRTLRDEARRTKPQRRGGDVADATGSDAREPQARDGRQGAGGGGEALPDASGGRRRSGQRNVHAGQQDAAGRGEVAHADTGGRNGRARGFRQKRRGESADFCPEVFVRLPDGTERPIRESDWSVEPNVGRVAHGVPARVDRLRGLGNAVVPQVAEYIGRAIVAANA